MNISEYLSKLKTFNLLTEVSEIMRNDTDDLRELVKDQLYAGLDGDEKELRPTYFEDPYFKSRASAENYSKWKDALSQRGESIFAPRKRGTPNLIITGSGFYDRIRVDITDSIIIKSSGLSDKLISKYGESILKLSKTAIGYYIEEKLFNKLKKRFNEHFS